MDELTSHAFHNRVVNRASAGTVPNDWIFSTVGCFSVRLCVCVSLRWLDGRPVHAASSMITSTWSGRWRGARSDTWQKVKVSWVRTNGEGGGVLLDLQELHFSGIFSIIGCFCCESGRLERLQIWSLCRCKTSRGMNPDTMQEERLSLCWLYSACSEVQFLYKSMEAVTLSPHRLRSLWAGASLRQRFRLIEFSEIYHQKKQEMFSVAPQQLIT